MWPLNENSMSQGHTEQLYSHEKVFILHRWSVRNIRYLILNLSMDHSMCCMHPIYVPSNYVPSRVICPWDNVWKTSFLFSNDEIRCLIIGLWWLECIWNHFGASRDLEYVFGNFYVIISACMSLGHKLINHACINSILRFPSISL